MALLSWRRLSAGLCGVCVYQLLYGFVSYLPASHFIVLTMQYSPEQYTATSVAMYNLLQQTASVIQPVFLGAVIDGTGGFTAIWFVFAVAMAISVFAIRLTPAET